MVKSEVRSNTFKFSQSVIKIRLWEEENLPLSQSRIAFDLFVLLANASCAQQPLTPKRLFIALKYSERGIRNVLTQFISGGWCEVICDSEDRRCRYIVATKRLTDAFAAYEQVVLSSYLGCVERDK